MAELLLLLPLVVGQIFADGRNFNHWRWSSSREKRRSLTITSCAPPSPLNSTRHSAKTPLVTTAAVLDCLLATQRLFVRTFFGHVPQRTLGFRFILRGKFRTPHLISSVNDTGLGTGNSCWFIAYLSTLTWATPATRMRRSAQTVLLLEKCISSAFVSVAAAATFVVVVV